jgi:hypothetical protein
MNSTYNNRRENLRALLEQWGGPLPVARKLGYSNASFVVQMCGPNPTREVTEKTARKIEISLALPPGWLDESPATRTTSQVPVDTALVARIVQVVAQTADDLGIRLTPEKLGDVVALVYTDAESKANAIRPEFIHQVLRLAK